MKFADQFMLRKINTYLLCIFITLIDIGVIDLIVL